MTPSQLYDFAKKDKLCLKACAEITWVRDVALEFGVRGISRPTKSNAQFSSSRPSETTASNTKKNGDSSATDTYSAATACLAESEKTRLFGDSANNFLALIDPTLECSFISKRVVQLLKVSGQAVSVCPSRVLALG